jgi:5-methylcytosine-specific restriction endonuclease McrA
MTRRRCLCGKVACTRHGGSSGWAAYKLRRPDRAQAYASSEWQRRARAQLKASPNCVRCGARASHADHVLAVGLGGDFDGPLQSMCTPCHRAKTLQESHEAARRAAERRREESWVSWKQEER